MSDVWANPAAAPGGELYAKFAAAYNRARDQSIRLVFHGTAEANIDAICKHGLDPNRRGQHGQAHGRGEYFAEDSNISVAYCQGGKKMIVFAVLMDPSGLTKRTNGIVVINKVEHQLPMFVLTCEALVGQPNRFAGAPAMAAPPGGWAAWAAGLGGSAAAAWRRSRRSWAAAAARRRRSGGGSGGGRRAPPPPPPPPPPEGWRAEAAAVDG